MGGGCGSGRHGGARKRRVESCLALDVNELRRQGALTPGASGTVTWERDPDAVASADFRACTAELILCYGGHDTEAPNAIEQRVVLSFVPAAFGGARAYFFVPAQSVAGAFQYSTFAEVYSAAGAVTVLPMRASAKIRGEDHADAPTSSAREWARHSGAHLRCRLRSSRRGCGVEPLSACAATPWRPSQLPPRPRWRIGPGSSVG